MIAPARPLVADYSFISQVAECPRKAYYAYERGLQSDEKSIALHLGSVLHIGVDWLHTHDWDIDGALTACADAWGDFTLPPTHKHAYATLGHVEVILRNYIDDRRGVDDVAPVRLAPSSINSDLLPEGFDLITDADGFIRLVETPLGIKWGTISYAGKIDFPNMTGGSYALWDHKTTRTWLSEYWAQKYANSHQMRGYIAILRALTGLPFDRVYINGIYTGKEAADDDSKWAKRTTGRSRLFGPFVYSEQMLDETREWATYWLGLAEQFRADAYWPQNDKSCWKYGDACQFYDLCARSPHIRESIVQAKYTVRTLTGVLASGADSDD